MTQLIVDGQPFLMLAGELHNSSSACVEDVAASFPRLAALNLNTVLAVVSWELVEPDEGRFEFDLLDGLLRVARENGLRLVLLWFGSWKNGKSCYVPGWVKSDAARFPRMQTKSGEDTDVLSAFCSELREADARAFAATMRHIREVDSDEHTVLMMQVENEVGVLGQPRDFCAAADGAFGEPVPAELIAYLGAHGDELLPEVREPWEASGFRVEGDWQEVFGESADEVFMAWHIALHLEAVAAAGRAEHDLPMYANAWLKQTGMMHPGQYPSGGPVSGMLDVWRAAAPHIDFLAPDIYVEDFKDVCASYTRGGNPLFIPEARWDARAASTAFHAIGQHAALGFAPFAIDDVEPGHPLGDTYALLARMMPLVTQAQAEGRVAGFYQQDENDHSVFTLGGLRVHATTAHVHSESGVPGGGMILVLADDEYLAVGRNYYIEFSTPGADVPDVELISVDEGTIDDGQFVPVRRLNGDETLHGRAVGLRDRLTVCRVKINAKVLPIKFQPEWEFPA